MINILIKFQKWLSDLVYKGIVNLKLYIKNSYNLLSLIIDILTIFSLVYVIFKIHWLFFIFMLNAISYTLEMIKERHALLKYEEEKKWKKKKNQ